MEKVEKLILKNIIPLKWKFSKEVWLKNFFLDFFQGGGDNDKKTKIAIFKLQVYLDNASFDS